MVHRDEGFFSAHDHLRLFWETTFPEGASRAQVGVVHGYGDHCGRYRGAIEALAAQGFTVHAFDYRGHGKSDGRRGFCAHYGELVEDLVRFWQRIRMASGDQKAFLVAHSNGGLMALKWLETGGGQGLQGLVLSAPYLQLAITPPATKLFAARVANRLVPWIPLKTELTSKDLTRDEAVQRQTDEDPLYHRVVTPRWFNEAKRVQGEVLKDAASVTVPLFVFCGAEDPVAAPAAARIFFDAAGAKDKRFKSYPGMRHEPLSEQGREEVFRDIGGWISEHV